MSPEERTAMEKKINEARREVEGKQRAGGRVGAVVGAFGTIFRIQHRVAI